LITEANLSSSKKVIDEIIKRDIPDEDVEAIDLCLHSFIRGKPFVQLGPDTFRDFLVNAFCPTEVLVKDDEPMYLPSCRAELGSNLFQHLAKFGPDAPSLWNTSGSKISAVDRKRKTGAGTDEQPAVPKEIIIIPKPVVVAHKDWISILRTGMVSFNMKERAKSYRCHVVTNETSRAEIWKALQTALLVHDLDEEAPPEKKKKTDSKVVVTDAKDILALL